MLLMKVEGLKEQWQSMINETTQAFGLLSLLVTVGEKFKNVSGSLPLYLHPSLYRALNVSMVYWRYRSGWFHLQRDETWIYASDHQYPDTHHVWSRAPTPVKILDLRLVNVNTRGLRPDLKRRHLHSYHQLIRIDICWYILNTRDAHWL